MGRPRALVVTTVHVPSDARIFQRQIPALREAGFEVTYAAPWTDTSTARPAGLRTVDLPRAVGRRRLRPLLAARRVLRQESAAHDVVIVHDPELLIAVALARPLPPVVWDVHEDLAASLVARAWLPQWLRPVVVRAVRAIERWAERHVHMTLAEVAYQDRFRRRHPVVPNAPLIPPDVLPSGDERVVYVGRVAAGRGAQELVELGRRLRGHVKLEVIGDAETDVVQLLTDADARGDLTWLGFLPNPDALAHVRGAMAGLSLLHDLPNFRGSMPTKVMEYMACGVPVITTPLPLAVDVVNRSGAGEVVPFGDLDAVVAALSRLSDDAERRRELGRRGRSYAMERSWTIEGPRFADVIEGWVRSAPRS